MYHLKTFPTERARATPSPPPARRLALFLGILLGGAAAFAQTTIINGSRAILGDWDASASTGTRPSKVGIGVPPAGQCTNHFSIDDATRTTPIVVTTSAAHGYLTDQVVTVYGVLGNTAANGEWVITVTSPRKSVV